MSDFYICDQAEVRTKLKTLSKIGVSNDGWTHYYKDATKNEEWLLTNHESEQQGGSLLILKKLPRPTIDEVINIALTARNKNDIAGAIYDLLDREKLEEADFRMKLIQALKTYMARGSTGFDAERVKLMVKQCELLDIRNRREILGKHFTEIENDAKYFQTISQEAKSILNRIV